MINGNLYYCSIQHSWDSDQWLNHTILWLNHTNLNNLMPALIYYLRIPFLLKQSAFLGFRSRTPSYIYIASSYFSKVARELPNWYMLWYNLSRTSMILYQPSFIRPFWLIIFLIELIYFCMVNIWFDILFLINFIEIHYNFIYIYKYIFFTPITQVVKIR